jgi:8-oxo-dGTP diphosphatase
MTFDATFRFAIAAVDAVVFGIDAGELKILLRPVETETTTYAGMLCVPGGVMRPTENAPDTLTRILRDKAGLDSVFTEQLYTFTDINRDSRSRAVAIAYLTLVSPDVITNYTHEKATWVSVSRIPKLAYDHTEMYKMAHRRLASKLLYTSIARTLLPKQFTLSELQSVYEIVCGQVFDKRNFRKKILALNIIKDSGEVRSGVANRPAALYSFVGKSVVEIPVIAGM